MGYGGLGVWTFPTPLPMTSRTMKHLLLLGLFLTLLSPAAPAGLAAAAGGTVTGGVLTRAGHTVPDAFVQIEVNLPSGRVYTARARSDAQGQFAFRDVPPGTGVVRAGHPRVGRGHARVDVRSGQTSSVQIVLRR